MARSLIRHPLVPQIYVNPSYGRPLPASRSTNLKLNGNGCLATNVNGVENGDLLAFPYEPNSITPKAKIKPETTDFFVSDIYGDPDCPTEGFSSINQALDVLRQGKFVITVDDENEDSGGNLIMAASLATPPTMSFMLNHGSGIICVGMKEEDLGRLNLLATSSKHKDPSTPAYTTSMDAKGSGSPGHSAANRARTILALSSSHSRPEDFRRPGHVYPVMYRNGGVLSHVGHTEASVDLISLAGLPSVSVLSAIVDAKDGSIAPPCKALTHLSFSCWCQILRDMGIHTLRLMTNNPAKFTGLKGNGLSIVGRVPVLSPSFHDHQHHPCYGIYSMEHHDFVSVISFSDPLLGLRQCGCLWRS